MKVLNSMAETSFVNVVAFGSDGSRAPRNDIDVSTPKASVTRPFARVPSASVARTEELQRVTESQEAHTSLEDLSNDHCSYERSAADEISPAPEPLLIVASSLSEESHPYEFLLKQNGALRLWPGTWVMIGDRKQITTELGASRGFIVARPDPSIALQLAKTTDKKTRLYVEDFIVPLLIQDPTPRVTYINDGRAVFESIVGKFHIKNTNFSTVLCRLMLDRGSDKGIGWHNYTRFYAFLFESIFLDRTNVQAVMEIGLGTNNISIPSNMGADGIPGASLRGWRDYFSNAVVGGADVDREILFQEERIRTGFVDQTSADTFSELWQALQMPVLDLFIDDGLHTPDAARQTFAACLHWVRPGGLYVVEDVPLAQASQYLDFARASGQPALLIELPHHTNDVDNALLIVRRN